MTQRQVRLGLMLPYSGIEPRLADDLTDGMQAWFAANRGTLFVSAGQIPETLWPSLAESFTGAKFQIRNLSEEGLTPQSGDRTYHLDQGPQNFLSRPNAVDFTPEQRQQMSQFIDQLLQTQVPALGIESLQKAKEKLAAQQN